MSAPDLRRIVDVATLLRTGALAPQDLVLLGREARPPFLVGELGLRFHASRVAARQRTTSDKAMNCVTAAATTRRWKISWNPSVPGNGFGHVVAYVSAPTL